MRDSGRRTNKYDKKIRGLVLPGQKERFTSKIDRQVEIEHAVNGIVGSDINRIYYIIFGKEIEKLKGKYWGTNLYNEVCILETKWRARGLTLEKLTDIENYMNIPQCPAPPIPCSDWETQEECEDAGCYWYCDACHATPFPTEQGPCEAAGYFWWNGECHCVEAECEDYNNQIECEAAGCYWYNDACHSVPQPCPEDWCNTDWLYRKKLTIDNTLVPATLTNFPVLVSFTDADMSAKAKADGTDIMFCDPLEAKLDREIEYWDKATGVLVAWVRIPTLPHDVDYEFYVYYGNAAGAEANTTAVWNANFKAVLHMNQAAGNFLDSTSTGNNATNFGADYQAAGKIDYCANFIRANSDYARIVSPTGIPTGAAARTVEAWFYIPDGTIGTADQAIVAWGGEAGNVHCMLNIYPNPTELNMMVRFNTWGGCNFDSIGRPSLGTWVYAVIVYDGTNQKIYLGGNFDRQQACAINTSATDVFIGRRISAASFLNGLLDEVRISNIERSANWIKTCYNNQNNPAAFMAKGPEVECNI